MAVGKGIRKLIVGLGNPGPQYEESRHNVGYKVVDSFSTAFRIRLRYVRHHSFFGKGRIDGSDVILAKPVTFVNRSGKAIHSFLNYYDIGVEDVVLVYDDMDLELGKIRVRPGGSSGGHKGVESVMLWLSSDKFGRLRVGIGRERLEKMAGREFVLGRFYKSEKPVVRKAIDESVRAIEVIVKEGLSAAMNRFN